MQCYRLSGTLKAISAHLRLRPWNQRWMLQPITLNQVDIQSLLNSRKSDVLSSIKGNKKMFMLMFGGSPPRIEPQQQQPVAIEEVEPVEPDEEDIEELALKEREERQRAVSRSDLIVPRINPVRGTGISTPT